MAQLNPHTIGMISSYVGLNPTSVDWLWNQSPQSFGTWKTIQMDARSPHPDFLLLYQYDFKLPRSSSQYKNWLFHRFRKPELINTDIDVDTIFRGVPKERRIFLMREPPLEEVIEKQQTQYAIAQTFCGYVSGPSDFALVPDYMPAIWYVKPSFRDLETLPSPPKTRLCSWITSGISRTENHRKRLNFMRLLTEEFPSIDVYGRGLPDWTKSKGEVSNKWHVMSPYYYNLAIENYADNDWYASEKLWDALLSWCLPIYYGGSAASKLLPGDSFLRLPSLDQAGLNYIQNVAATPDLWHERHGAIAEARHIILHKLNLLNWLTEYTNAWG